MIHGQEDQPEDDEGAELLRDSRCEAWPSGVQGDATHHEKQVAPDRGADYRL